MEKLLPKRLPETPQAVKSPVPEPGRWRTSSRETAANLLVDCRQKRPAERLLPHMNAMTPHYRIRALAHLCTPRTLTNKVRTTLMACAAETNTRVREAALGYLKKCTLVEDEVRTLEGLLTRKQPDFRRGVFELLLNRPDRLALQSVERLLPGDALQRAGGIELARRLTEAKRLPDAVNKTLTAFLESKGAKLLEADREAIDRILHPEAAPPTLEDGLGLFNPKERSPVVPPRKLGVMVATSAAVGLLKSLDQLIEDNKQVEFERDSGHMKKCYVLGSVQYQYHFPQPDAKKSAQEDRANCPMHETWLAWNANRPDSTRDGDGLELVRAALTFTLSIRAGEDDSKSIGVGDDEANAVLKKMYPWPLVGLRHQGVVNSVVCWLLKLQPPEGAMNLALDATEDQFAAIPDSLNDRLLTVADAMNSIREQDGERFGLAQKYGLVSCDTDPNRISGAYRAVFKSRCVAAISAPAFPGNAANRSRALSHGGQPLNGRL